MISIIKRIYVGDNNEEDTITRLGLDVEEVSNLFTNSKHQLTIDTYRRWVGKINRKTGAFEVVKPNNTSFRLARLLDGNFHTIHIKGEVYREDSKTRIYVSFGLDYFDFFWLILLCLPPVLAIVAVSSDNESGIGIGSVIPFLIFFTIPSALTLIFQLNSNEKDLKDSLGVRAPKYIPKIKN